MMKLTRMRIPDNLFNEIESSALQRDTLRMSNNNDNEKGA